MYYLLGIFFFFLHSKLSGIFDHESGLWKYDVYEQVKVGQDPYDPNLVEATRIRASWTDDSLSRDSSGCLVGPSINARAQEELAPCGVRSHHLII